MSHGPSFLALETVILRNMILETAELNRRTTMMIIIAKVNLEFTPCQAWIQGFYIYQLM